MKKILIGYDGTRSAEYALIRARELAEAFTASVVVVDVATPPSATGSGGAFGLMPYYEAFESGPSVNEALWQEHRKHVQAMFDKAGIALQFAGVVGNPAEAIAELAEQEKADLIVVGTREPGFFERLLGGSVSRDVARRAHCDVLIVHTPVGVEPESATIEQDAT